MRKKVNKIQAFTLAEILIVLVIIGVLTMILLPVAFQSSPNEDVMRFKKGYNTLLTAIRELVSSDRYYQNGDLGRRANGDLVDGKHDGDLTYFCETLADILSTKEVNCNEGALDNFGSTAGMVRDDGQKNDLAINSIKAVVDEVCSRDDVQELMGNQIVTTDNIYYFESGPERTFGSNHGGKNCSWEDCKERSLAGPDDIPYFQNENGFDLNYKIFCMDIDGPYKGETPFGFGIRADGKVMTGKKADEWMNKKISGNN